MTGKWWPSGWTGKNGWKRDGQDKFDWNCFAHGKFGAGQLDGGVGETKMNLV
jgi:hypothetical protein